MYDYSDECYALHEVDNEKYEKKVQIADHHCCISALKIIIEELYESNGEINHEILRENLACLCDEFGVEDYSLRKNIQLTRRHPLYWQAYGLSKTIQGAI